jgi:CheY-like chemotaxis protein
MAIEPRLMKGAQQGARLPARVATPYTLVRDHWPSRNGPAGVAIAPAAAPDIAFIDIVIPGVDSPEVGRRIRAAGGER